MKAGFNVLGGIDTDPYGIETARRNIKRAEWEILSIEELASKVENGHRHIVLDADVILAGLPCQGFSIAGKRDSADQRNKLYKYLLRIVAKVQPEFVMVENVQGLLSRRNRNSLEGILNGLNRLGYDGDHRLYDAANLGVPQFRERVFIVASRSIPVRFIFESMRFLRTRSTVKAALKGLPPNKEIESLNHTFMKHSKKVVKKIKGIKDAKLISYRRVKWNEPSVTIISGHNALPVHPQQHRAISNREAARIQGIPDAFVFEGPRTSQTLQVANAVAYPVARRIAKAVSKAPERLAANRGQLFEGLVSRTDKGLSRLFRKRFIGFYQKYGREYPWRYLTDPYRILLTEILLQRTKADMVLPVWKQVVDSVKPSKNGFKTNPATLRKCFRKIGIFNRANTIISLNDALVQYYRGRVPENYDELMNLPGVGIYIAAAVRTFAFDIPDFPVDSNSLRFTHRFFGMPTSGRKSEARQIREFMNTIIDKKKPKEFVYGFLDFCSAICRPRSPGCAECFVRSQCSWDLT